MIKKENGKWVLYTKDGSRKLGTHSSKKKAIEQEIALKIAKSKRK